MHKRHYHRKKATKKIFRGPTVYVVFNHARNAPHIVGLFKTKSGASVVAKRAQEVYGTTFTACALTQSMVKHFGPAEWRKLARNPRYRLSAIRAYKEMKERYRLNPPSPFSGYID